MQNPQKHTSSVANLLAMCLTLLLIDGLLSYGIYVWTGLIWAISFLAFSLLVGIWLLYELRHAKEVD